MRLVVGFPQSEPAEYRLSWVQEERMVHMTLLGGLLTKVDCDDEIEVCLQQLEGLEQLDVDLLRSGSPQTSVGCCARKCVDKNNS